LGQREFFLLLLFRWFWFRRETVGCQSERKGHGSADTLTGGEGDLVEDLIPPSFIGTFFLSTHGFLQSVVWLSLAGMSRLIHWLAGYCLFGQN
jgi:hypothetical protein